MPLSERKIRKHYNELRAIYGPLGLSVAGDVVSLARISRIEARLHQYAEDACNIPLSETQIRHRERQTESMLDEVRAMLPAVAEHIFANGDPRGYALKINDEHMRTLPDSRLLRDWGGYGIIDPQAQLTE